MVLFTSLGGRLRSSSRFRLGVIGFLLSASLYLLVWSVCRQLGEEAVLYQKEVEGLGEIKLGTTVFLWWFRGLLLSIWSISVSVYLLFIHPDSAYQQAKATFRRFREEQRHTYRNAFLRSLATSLSFQSVVKQGFFLSVLVINGFSRVSTVDFALGFAAWLILVFLFLLLLRLDPSPSYGEFQSDWDLLVQQFWKNTKKGGGLYAITTVVTVTMIQATKIYLNNQNLAFEKDKLEFRKGKFGLDLLKEQNQSKQLERDLLREQNQSKQLERDLLKEQNRAEELKSKPKGPFGLW